MSNIIVFLHFHKSGGSTINNLFDSYIKHKPNKNGNPWKDNQFIKFWEYNKKEFNQFKKYLNNLSVNFICLEWNFFINYNKLNYNGVELITCLREPYERYKSNMNFYNKFNYKNYESKNLHQRCKIKINYNKFNYYVKMLNGLGNTPEAKIDESHFKIARKNLRKLFKTIIILENKESFKLLEKFNIKYDGFNNIKRMNSNKKDIDINRNEFKKLNFFDYKLYNYAKRLSEYQLQEYKNSKHI